MSDDLHLMPPPDDDADDVPGAESLESELRAALAPVRAPGTFRERLRAELLGSPPAALSADAAPLPPANPLDHLPAKRPRRGIVVYLAAHRQATATVTAALAVAAAVLAGLVLGGNLPLDPLSSIRGPGIVVPTATRVPTATQRPSHTPTDTPAPTSTPRPTHTPPPTYTPRPTAMPTHGRPVAVVPPPAPPKSAPTKLPPTASPTAHMVVMPVRRPTMTPLPTATPSPVPSSTATATSIPPSQTPIPTSTSTSVPTPLPTTTPPPTAVPTEAPPPTPTATDTAMAHPATPTARVADTATARPTATAIPPSPTPTAIPPSPTRSETATATSRPTRTETPPATATQTPAATPSSTAVPSATATPRPTRTATPTPTRRPTDTAIPSPTNSPTPTETATASATATPTLTETATPTDTATPTPSATATPRPILNPLAQPRIAPPAPDNALLDSPLLYAQSITQSITSTVPVSWSPPMMPAQLSIYPISVNDPSPADVYAIAQRLGANGLLTAPSIQNNRSIVATLQLGTMPYTLTVYSGYGTDWFSLQAAYPAVGRLSLARAGHAADTWLRSHGLLSPNLIQTGEIDGRVQYGETIGGAPLRDPVAVSISLDGGGVLQYLRYEVVATSGPPVLLAAQSPAIATSNWMTQGAGFYHGPDPAIFSGPAEIDGLSLAYVGLRAMGQLYLVPIYVLTWSAPSASGQQTFTVYTPAVQ